MDDPAHRTQDHPCRPAGELRDDHRGELGIVVRMTMLVSLRLRIIMFVSVIFIVRSLVILAAGRLVTPNRSVRCRRRWR